MMNEHESRLQMMTEDKRHLTWDLSPNDVAAIRWALDEIAGLREQAHRFYRSDGTFTLLSTPEEAVKARIACAQMIEQFQADNQPRS